MHGQDVLVLQLLQQLYLAEDPVPCLLLCWYRQIQVRDQHLIPGDLNPLRFIERLKHLFTRTLPKQLPCRTAKGGAQFSSTVRGVEATVYIAHPLAFCIPLILR